MGGVHKPNEINSLIQLHIISHKTVEIIKMKMFVVVKWPHLMILWLILHAQCQCSQDRSLPTNIVNYSKIHIVNMSYSQYVI